MDWQESLNPDVDTPTRRLRLIFSGRVQGVGFRATAVGVARGYAVTGFVRNEPDASVYAEVQGTSSEIDAFVRTLQARMASNIAGMRSDPISPRLDEHGFVIES